MATSLKLVVENGEKVMGNLMNIFSNKSQKLSDIKEKESDSLRPQLTEFRKNNVFY